MRRSGRGQNRDHGHREAWVTNRAPSTNQRHRSQHVSSTEYFRLNNGWRSDVQTPLEGYAHEDVYAVVKPAEIEYIRNRPAHSMHSVEPDLGAPAAAPSPHAITVLVQTFAGSTRGAGTAGELHCPPLTTS